MARAPGRPAPTASLFEADDFIQVEDEVGGGGVGGELDEVEGFVAF